MKSPGTHDPAEVRRTIILLSVAGFVPAATTRLLDAMVGAIARDLATDPHTVALVASAYALPYALIQPILGPVGDALGKERIIKILLAALTAALATSALVRDVATLAATRVAAGAAAGGVIPLSLAIIGDRVAMAERQVAIGRFLTAAISGMLLGGAGAGLLADLVGWRAVFGVASGLSALAALSISFGFRSANTVRGRFSLPDAMQRYRKIIAVGRARALMSFVFAEGVLVFGVPPYLAPLLEEAGLGGPTEAGLIVAGFAIGGVVYTLIVRWLLGYVGLRRMLILGGFVTAGAFCLLAPTWSWPAQAAAMFAAGLGFYMLHNSYQTQMTEVAPEARGSAVALHAFSFFIGQALGPVVFGLLLSRLGRDGGLALCAAGLVALGFVSSRVLVGRQPLAR